MNEWKLDMSEVSVKSAGGSWGGHTKNTKSRAKFPTSAFIEVEHVPTKIILRGDIPEGYYTRNQMRDLIEKLKKTLLVELEKKVARALRVPGQ